MKEITVISGKGGTGKTSITASFAVLAQNHVMADCDVDAANLHILLSPEIKTKHNFWGMPKVEIDTEKCSCCGICENLCRYGAIRDGKVNSMECEGCRVCYHACPEKAIRLKEILAGEYYLSKTRFSPFVHARLGVAQENSGKLVAEVRRQARDLAQKEGRELIITDGPPGIGCPVISSLGGTDLALVVVEPTLSSIHDLDRVLKLTAHFNVKTAVCINKWDLNTRNSSIIEEACRNMDIPVIGKIGYDITFMAAVMARKPVIQMISSAVEDIVSLWHGVEGVLNS